MDEGQPEDELTLPIKCSRACRPSSPARSNTWNIEPLAADRVVLTSRIDLALAPGTPGPAGGMVKGQFTQLLDISADELVHFVETGRPHPRKVAAQKMPEKG